MAPKFGQLLLWGNLITQEQLQQALSHQKEFGGRLGEVLTRLGYISEDDITRTLGMKYGVPTVNLDQLKIDKDTLSIIPVEMARSKRVLPLSRLGSILTCAMEDPTRIDVINAVEFQTGFNLQPVLVPTRMMSEALDKYYPEPHAPLPASPAASVQVRNPQLHDITNRLQKLPPEKLEYVKRFLDSIL